MDAPRRGPRLLLSVELRRVGLALLLLVIAFTAWMLVGIFQPVRALHDDTRIVAATLLLALVSLAVSMGFVSIALNKPLWIIVGLTIALERLTASTAEEAKREQQAGPA